MVLSWLNSGTSLPVHSIGSKSWRDGFSNLRLRPLFKRPSRRAPLVWGLRLPVCPGRFILPLVEEDMAAQASLEADLAAIAACN